MTTAVLTSMGVKLAAVFMLAWRKRLDDANYTLAYVREAERGSRRVVADYHKSYKGQPTRRIRAI